jgi:hypothetical protein
VTFGIHVGHRKSVDTLEENTASIFRVKEYAKQEPALLHTGCLPDLLFDCENGGNIFFQNISSLSLDYIYMYIVATALKT